MPATEPDSSIVKAVKAIEGWAVEYGPTVMVALAGLGWTFLKDFVTKPPAAETCWHIAARIGSGAALCIVGVGGAILAYRRGGAIRQLKADKTKLEAELDQTQRQIGALVQNATETWRLKLHRIFTSMGLDASFRI